MVSRLFERGGFNPAQVGLSGTSGDYYTPFYRARRADPVYTIHGGSSTRPYAVDGQRIRLPAGARPAGGSDGGIGVVYRGYWWGFGEARINHSNRTISASYGRKLPLNGDGLNAAETSSRWASVAGYVRYPELASGHVNHALFFASSQVARSHVYPAGASDGDNDPGSGYPPMGTHFQLDPSYMNNARLARYPQWKRAILRAMRDYGFYLSDTTGSPIGSVRFESGLSYTSLGRSDPFVAYARRHHLPHSYDSEVGRTTYEFNLQSGVDWKKLRVVDPCQSRGAC